MLSITNMHLLGLYPTTPFDASLTRVMCAAVYLVGVNAGAAGVFWYDKKCAGMFGAIL